MTFEVTSATYVEAVASAQVVDVALPFSYPLAAVSVSYLDAVVSYAQYLDAVVVMGHLVYAAEPEPTDTTAPTLAISSGAASIYQGATTSLTFTFSEDVGATFTQADVVVTGGTLSNFTGAGVSYSATFTGSSVGTASISVASGAYADAAGNLGAAASLAVTVLEVAAPIAWPTVLITAGSSNQAGTYSINRLLTVNSAYVQGQDSVVSHILSVGADPAFVYPHYTIEFIANSTAT